MPADPRCPWCNASGINHIAIKKLPGVAVVYCGQCGAVYGVASLPQVKPVSPKKPAPVKRGLLKNAPPRKSPHVTPAKPKKQNSPHISRGTPINKPYRTPGNPDPLPRNPPTKKRRSPNNPLDIDQLGAMLAASAGGMYYHVFNDEEDDEQ